MLALDKWASCVIARGHDKLLGRWLYLEMVGQQGQWIIVLSAYHVCPQPFDATYNKVMAQQTRLLQLNGIQNPNPRQQFILDIILQINSWWHEGKEVLIGMDVNKDVNHPHSKISRIFTDWANQPSSSPLSGSIQTGHLSMQ